MKISQQCPKTLAATKQSLSFGLLALFSLCGYAAMEAPSWSASVKNIDSSRATIVDPQCRQFPRDRYDLGWRFTANSQDYLDECVDTSSMRPVQILKNDSQQLVFANFYHNGKFWVATWNKSDRPKVQYFGLHFDAGVPFVTAGHTELHFIFPQGLSLQSQVDDEKIEMKDVIISWQATFPQDKTVGYNLFIGLGTNFGLSCRALSLSTTVIENILPDHSIRQFDSYDLSLTAAQGSELFLVSLEKGNALGLSSFYRTLTPNCASETFDMIDQTLQDTNPDVLRGVKQFQTGVNLDPIIGPSHQALIDRRLISESQQPKHLYPGTPSAEPR